MKRRSGFQPAEIVHSQDPTRESSASKQVQVEVLDSDHLDG